MSEIVLASVLLVVLPVCGVAALAIWSSMRAQQALVETNAMLSYTTRMLADVAAVPREEQVDRIRELSGAMEPRSVDAKPRSVGMDKAGGYLPDFLDRDYSDEPAGGGV